MKPSPYLLITILLAVLFVSVVSVVVLPLLGIFLLAGSIILCSILAIINIYEVPIKKLVTLGSFIPAVILISISLAYKTSVLSLFVLYILLLCSSGIYILQVDKVRHFPKFKRSFYLLHALSFGLELGFIFSLMTKHVASGNIVSFFIAIIGSGIIGITEAIYFQSLFQRYLTRIVHPAFAIIATSLLYVLFHFSVHISSIVLWMIIGGVTSLLYALTENIYFSILLSVTMNIVFFYFSNNFMALAIV